MPMMVNRLLLSKIAARPWAVVVSGESTANAEVDGCWASALAGARVFIVVGVALLIESLFEALEFNGKYIDAFCGM